jgi:SAM-dependent methyltransferase
MGFAIDEKTGRLITYMGETHKSRARREREGWFEKYAPSDKPGLDIGCQNDPLNLTFRRWDKKFGDGDATELHGVPPETYFTVYASHVLEHIPYRRRALRRWYEVLKPGGHLIVVVPHRDMYEQKKRLPSARNFDHVSFWLPDEEEPPSTKSLKKEILAAIKDADIVSFRVLDEGFKPKAGPKQHPCGEYSIEAIVRKPAPVTSLEHKAAAWIPSSDYRVGGPVTSKICHDV